MPITEAFPRDANNVPITTDGLISTDVQTLIGNNATPVVPIFRITGIIECRGLWGVVTTTLGANNTAAYFRLNDQTTQSNITLNTGTTLSGAVAGAILVKKGLAAAAVTLLDATQGRVSEPTTLETSYFSPFLLQKKPAANTDIEFVYSTTDTPTSGVIKFFLRWLPVSSDGNVLAL